MKAMKNLINRFVRDTEGQDLIEYALLTAFVGLAATPAMTVFSTGISTQFSRIASAVTAASLPSFPIPRS